MRTKSAMGLRALDRKLKKIVAKDMMTRDVITTTRDANLHEVAGLMIRHRVSGLPVLTPGGKVEGIITENDLFMVMDMVKSGDIDPDARKGGVTPRVAFAMSTAVTSVAPTTTLDEIIVLMKFRNQHTLPVVEKGKLLGVIGKRDVFRCFYAALASLEK